jgi:hypothetical protein
MWNKSFFQFAFLPRGAARAGGSRESTGTAVFVASGARLRIGGDLFLIRLCPYEGLAAGISCARHIQVLAGWPSLHMLVLLSFRPKRKLHSAALGAVGENFIRPLCVSRSCVVLYFNLVAPSLGLGRKRPAASGNLSHHDGAVSVSNLHRRFRVVIQISGVSILDA